jgi:hypothetical protein
MAWGSAAIGPRGEPAPAICGWRVDCAAYTAVPLLSDRSEGAPLELRGLFKQFLERALGRLPAKVQLAKAHQPSVLPPDFGINRMVRWRLARSARNQGAGCILLWKTSTIGGAG